MRKKMSQNAMRHLTKIIGIAKSPVRHIRNQFAFNCPQYCID